MAEGTETPKSKKGKYQIILTENHEKKLIFFRVESKLININNDLVKVPTTIANQKLFGSKAGEDIIIKRIYTDKNINDPDLAKCTLETLKDFMTFIQENPTVAKSIIKKEREAGSSSKKEAVKEGTLKQLEVKFPQMKLEEQPSNSVKGSSSKTKACATTIKKEEHSTVKLEVNLKIEEAKSNTKKTTTKK